MAKAFLVALAAGIFCLLGMLSDARATVTFSLVWEATTGAGITGSNAINAAPGDILTLALRMTTDQTLCCHGVTLNFDTDLGNELNLLNANGGKNWAGTTYGTVSMTTTYSELAPIGSGSYEIIESTGTVAGQIGGFNGGIKPGYFDLLPTGTYTVGTARFVSNGGTTDGADVFVGLFSLGLDDVVNNVFLVIPASGLVFGIASVNAPIPEPGTAVLVGLGLVGILLVCRRSRRS